MRILLLCLLLPGCGGGFDLVKTSDVFMQTIIWEKFDPVTCGGKAGTGGCAYINESPCRIQMREDAPDWIVAEEFRHCFGWSHGD